MATYLEHGAGGTRLPVAEQPLVFQRGHRSAVGKGSRKRRVLRVKHVLAMFALLAGFFFALDRAYLFLISWDRLTVRTVELGCGRKSLRRTLEGFIASRPIGNLLLCDISTLQQQLKAYPGVKDARVQKVFPSTLKIEIVERLPFALLDKGGLAVVDRDGIGLETSASEGRRDLPVVRDENAFRSRQSEKWETARLCLEALTRAERARLLSLECSDDGRLTLQFREDPLLLILDGTSVREKLDRFSGCRGDLESRFGALEYADLRLDDRIIVRPLESAPENGPAKSQKEAE